MKNIKIILFLIIFICSIFTIEGFKTPTIKKMFCVEKDGIKYCVVNNEKKDESMKLLQETFDRLNDFFIYLESNYPNRVETKHFKNYNFKYISESSFKDKPAYFLKLINEIGVCLRNENGEMITKNVLFYVLLHEVTHTIYSGHSDVFWDSFKFLTNAAIEGNYLKKGVDLEFCSRKIDIISRK